MTREELIENMCAAYHRDWDDADWPGEWRNGERSGMARVLDAIEPLIRADERKEIADRYRHLGDYSAAAVALDLDDEPASSPEARCETCRQPLRPGYSRCATCNRDGR